VGAILGATVALLLAPATGGQTRHRIARRFRGADDDVWEELAEELELAAAEREEEASLSAES
jgi:gas vesicle protein